MVIKCLFLCTGTRPLQQLFTNLHSSRQHWTAKGLNQLRMMFQDNFKTSSIGEICTKAQTESPPWEIPASTSINADSTDD